MVINFFRVWDQIKCTETKNQIIKKKSKYFDYSDYSVYLSMCVKALVQSNQQNQTLIFLITDKFSTNLFLTKVSKQLTRINKSIT